MINLELPYNAEVLSPYFSTDGFNEHYQVYLTYQTNLNHLTSDTIFERTDLNTLLRITRGSLQFNAIQVWNHIFYFSALTPRGSCLGPGSLRQAINGCFGSFQSFRELFLKYGNRGEASGWIWLVVNADGALEITRDHGSKHPLLRKTWPVFACDLWSHAFERDFGSDREKYIDTVLTLADWKLVETRFSVIMNYLDGKILQNIPDEGALIL